LGFDDIHANDEAKDLSELFDGLYRDGRRGDQANRIEIVGWDVAFSVFERVDAGQGARQVRIRRQERDKGIVRHGSARGGLYAKAKEQIKAFGVVR
jgi:hypothetical protein